jgi:hypothetical protein
MAGEFQVSGQNAAALFTLKLHRGDGMTLIAMNWKDARRLETLEALLGTGNTSGRKGG